MGRGNVCVHYECEGLYYLDKEFLDVYRKVHKCDCGHVSGFDLDAEPMTERNLREAGIAYDFDGSRTDYAYDEEDSRQNWDDMIEIVRERFMKQFKSFSAVDKWRKRGEVRVVLESGLFEIAVEDNEWSAAWCLLEREDIDDVGANRTFMRRHHKTYLEAIKQTLVDAWGEAIGYGGAWTHGATYRKEAHNGRS